MKKHPITKVYVSATPNGRIKAKAYRGNKKDEPVLFDTVQNFFEWPELSEETKVEFTPKGIIPRMALPCEPIFYFCAPDEIKDFISLTDAGDRVGWLEKYTDLIKALHAEQFDVSCIVGNSVDFTDLISNPKGYTPEEMIRRYEDIWSF